jgi:hypothetical protein
VKVIRVLVYEGDEAALQRDLKRRVVKASHPYGPVTDQRYSITETFVDADRVRAWLGEQVSDEDMRAAESAARVALDTIIGDLERGEHG